MFFWSIFSGRIHSAVVSGINPETRSVTVEWFEQGETKGKEVSEKAKTGVLLCQERGMQSEDHCGFFHLFSCCP